MFEDFFLEFEKPIWLTLIILILPCYLLARQSTGGLSLLKTHITFALRAVVILLLAMSLAHPTWLKKGDGLTVIVLWDRSDSIPFLLQNDILTALQNTTSSDTNRRPEDRLGIITIGGEAAISALPNRNTFFDNFADNLRIHAATNLAAGVQQAMSLVPKDTACRFVIISDGNETDGEVLDAVKIAKANNIPIDVWPVVYKHDREVVFDRLVAPARAREGQVTTLRMILRAQAPTSGTITLTQNGILLDLDPDTPGNGIHVELNEGVNTHQVPIIFDQAGPQQFKAKFEADDPGSDLIVQNNTHDAVTYVSGTGRVLIIDDSISESIELVNALEANDLSVDVLPPELLSSIVVLGGYDSVIMVNQSRGSYDDKMEQWLHDYVHDLGGGLIMIGGPDTFGAGGWNNSKLEDALPVKLDPPQKINRQRGALALIMHSCEMAYGNYWGEKIATTAINALSRLDYIGILDYNWTNGGCVWEWGPDLAGDKSGAIAAAKSMPVGDMPDFQTAMQLAYNDLIKINANRHVIITSDGDPSPPTQKLLNDFAAAQITVTTVLLAGHGGSQTMKDIALKTGGQFYNPTNPKRLPEIIIAETKLIARSLVVEGDEYITQRIDIAEPTRGFNNLPSVDGYVLTEAKTGLSQISYNTDKHGDPLYVSWNYGLGKSVAFTSDVSGRWASKWITWPGFKGFWDQTVRWAMRPVTPSNMTVQTRREGDKAIIEVEALDTDEAFLNNLNTSAAVLGPDGTHPLTLQQVGPGKYRGEFPVDLAGPYLVNMHFKKGTEMVGNLQAAVSVPYAREYRSVTDNQAKMYAIADATDGRILSEQGQFVDLWDRQGLEARKSHKPIWDLLAIIAATIFLFDVAARRLSVGVAEMRTAMNKMFGKRSDVSEDTVEAWKKARSQVSHRKEHKPEKPKEDISDIKFEVDESTAAQAIDVGSEAVSDASRAAQPKRKVVKDSPVEDEGDFTSRLLAAKKRARDQHQGGKGNSGDSNA